MNERIKELAEQSLCIKGGEFAFNGGEVELVDLKKFAQLIVRECIAQCESQNTVITTATGTEHWGEISDAVEQIKKHFGVEE